MAAESQHVRGPLSLIHHTLKAKCQTAAWPGGINDQLSCCSNTKMADKRLGADREG